MLNNSRLFIDQKRVSMQASVFWWSRTDILYNVIPFLYVTSRNVHYEPMSTFAKLMIYTRWSVWIDHQQRVVYAFFSFPCYTWYILHFGWCQFISQLTTDATSICNLLSFNRLISYIFRLFLGKLKKSDKKIICVNQNIYLHLRCFLEQLVLYPE